MIDAVCLAVVGVRSTVAVARNFDAVVEFVACTSPSAFIDLASAAADVLGACAEGMGSIAEGIGDGMGSIGE